MAVVGSASVQLVARTGKFAAGMRRAGSALRRVGATARRVSKGIGNLAGKFLRLGSVAAALAAGAFGLLIRQQLKLGDQIAKTADKLGIGTKRLEAFKIAAELAGTDLRTLEKGLLRMTVNMADAAKGIGEAADTIKDLGLDAEKVSKLPIGEQFLQVADAMARLSTSTQRATAAYELFGGRGVALVNIMQEGRKSIEDVAKEMEGLGVLFSRLDLRKIEILNDSFTKIKTIIGAIARSFAILLAGPMNALLERTKSWVKEMGGAQNIVKTILGFLKSAAFAAARAIDTVLRGLKRGFLEVKLSVITLARDWTEIFLDLGISLKEAMGAPAEEIDAFAAKAALLAVNLGESVKGARAELMKFKSDGETTFLPMQRALHTLLKFLSNLNKGLGDTAKKSLDAVKAFREGLVADGSGIAGDVLGGRAKTTTGRLAPTFAAGSVGAQQAAFKAQSQQQGMINVLTDMLRNSQQRKVTDATRNTLLSKLLAAEENKPLITIS